MSKDFPLYKYYFEVNVIKGSGSARSSGGGSSGSGSSKSRSRTGKQDLVRCHEVNGLGITYTFKDVNSASHQSHRGKSLDESEYQNVTLKKGLYTNDPSSWSSLREAAFNNRSTKTHVDDLYCQNVLITLKEIESDSVVMSWVLHDAFVSSWKISDFNSMESAIAEETVEFVFDTLSFEMS